MSTCISLIQQMILCSYRLSLILLCPSDFSSLYKARAHIQMNFTLEKEIPILKDIAQQPATICEVDINNNKT